MPIVYTNGSICLRTLYRDKDWLFHESVSLRAGGKIIKSAVIPVYSRNNIEMQDKAMGGIKEELHFLEGQDNGIIEAISNCNESDYVSVRFDGRNDSKIITLSPREIRATKDCLELSMGLKALNLKSVH